MMDQAELQALIDRLESPAQRALAQHHFDAGDAASAALVVAAPREWYAQHDWALLVAFLLGMASQL